METKVIMSKDKILNNNDYDEDEQIEIARRVLEAEEILYEREQG